MVERDTRVDRRKLLQTLAIGGALGLAGCAGDDPDDDRDPVDEDELGERVPTQGMGYWSNTGTITSIWENVVPIAQSNIEELGINIEVQPVEYTTDARNITADTREYLLRTAIFTWAPQRTDPQQATRLFSIDTAGDTGQLNMANYASCEYSELAWAQETATDPDERREMLYEAHSILSNDIAIIPLFPTVLMNAVNTDILEVNGAGEAGHRLANPHSMVESRPIGEAESIRTDVGAQFVESTNYLTTSAINIYQWSTLAYSPLLQYDENYELQPMVAQDYETERDSSRFVFELRDDFLWHNGDPVTAEDVKFTYEDVLYERGDAFPQAPPDPHESVNIVDDRTVEFNFETPYLPFITETVPRWGILKEDHSIDAGILEDPGGFTWDEVIGCGPFEVAHFESGSSVILDPFDDHPVLNANARLELIHYRDSLSAYNAFEQGELSFVGVSPDLMARAQNELDFAEIQVAEEFHPYSIYPQMPAPPTKFWEFRDALGKCLNRRQMVESAMYDQTREAMHASILQNHPFRPPDDMLYKFTDDPSGDLEAARQVLEDAGWGWDNDGNLHYPPDADLSELWPAEDVPSVDDFPCLAEVRD